MNLVTIYNWRNDPDIDSDLMSADKQRTFFSTLQNLFQRVLTDNEMEVFLETMKSRIRASHRNSLADDLREAWGPSLNMTEIDPDTFIIR